MAAEDKKRGKRKKAIHKLDEGAIRMLHKFQKKHGCDLRPNVVKEPCASCADSKKCIHFGWERDYIHKHDTAKVESLQRKRTASAQERKSAEEFTTPAYPCEPLDFACPDRDNCHEGDFCRWRNE